MNYADELKSGMRWQRERAEELKKNLETQTTIDEKGIMRWTTNNRVPPLDCLEFAKFGLKIPVDIPASIAQGDKETQKDLQEYRIRMAEREITPEERFEMEAAFGKGTTIVDIITGKEIQL